MNRKRKIRNVISCEIMLFWEYGIIKKTGFPLQENPLQKNFVGLF